MDETKENNCENCPYFFTQKIFKGKWSTIILYHLFEGTKRFNELQKLLPDITHSTLSNQLKQLEKKGLIIRTEYPQIPPKVEYSLTQIGRDLIPVMQSLQDWGEKYENYIKNEIK